MKLFAYWLVFAASASIALVHGLLWRSWLPERVPTHFGINGVPNAWMSRDGALLSYFAGVAITALVLAGLVVLLPRLPVSVINIPNREYWFAEARIAEIKKGQDKVESTLTDARTALEAFDKQYPELRKDYEAALGKLREAFQPKTK